MRITDKIAEKFGLDRSKAFAIVAASRHELQGRMIPSDADVVGHIGPDGSSVHLVAGDRAIVELRVPAGLLAA